MSEYLSPDSYVEEFDNALRAVEGVATGTAGFVGMAERGPSAGPPSLCTNFDEFQCRFGGYLSERTHGTYRYLPSSVYWFFANGGARCYVSRVVPEDAACAQAAQGGLTLRAADEGAWGNRLQACFSAHGERTSQPVRKEGELDVRICYGDTEERYRGVSLNPASDRYLATVLSKSGLVAVERLEAPEDMEFPIAALFGVSGDSVSLSFAGGSDGTPGAVTPGVFIGRKDGPGGCTGIQAFLDNAEAAVIAVPGVTMPEVAAALAAHCEHTRRRFAVLDMPPELTEESELLEYRGSIDSSYAAMYHPWIECYDFTVGKDAPLPPSGAVMGVYARSDKARGVHKAPANEIVVCTGLSADYTQEKQAVLNPGGVNLIRELPGRGQSQSIRVWGARTASRDPLFRYVNVRRLFIYVEESLKSSTAWVAFETNDATLWARVERQITAFLDKLFRAGMLAGDSPEEAFSVSVGPSTMSRDDILNGRLICEIGIAPSRPAEFVIFRITQYTAEAQH